MRTETQVIGALQGQAGRHRQALDAFTRASEIIPFDPEIRYNRAIALLSLGQTAEAEAQLCRALDADPAFRQARAKLEQLAAGKQP